jgi:hypothetical protein
MRYLFSRAAVALLFLLSATTSQATTFIKDVKLIGGSKAECKTLKETLTAQGWTFIDYDLNKGCGEESDFVYLLYKAEENNDGVNWGYITDFYIHEEKNPPSSLTYNGRTYNKASYDGGEWFVDHYGDLNSNCGGGSAYIYLYYTKALFPDNRAVTSITINNTSTGAVGWEGNGSAADLNKGCGDNTPYIYMHFTTATAMAGHQPQASLEACTGGKYQISVRGWAYDPDATAQSIGVQVKIYQSDGTTLYRTENLTANQSNANAGVSGNHGFAATFTGIPAATYKLKLFAIDYNGDGDTQIGAVQTVTVTGTQPSGRIDACTGGEGEITVRGWAYDPDASAQSIGVQVKVYQSDGTTLYKQENLTANLPRNDVNTTYSITGQHGYSATIDDVAEGTYKVKVYAIDTNGDGNPQIGSTQTVSVTKGPVRLTSETGEVTLVDGDVLTGTGGADTHVTIAAGATVTLNGVNITGIPNDNGHDWAGLTCAGNAVIILANGTTNDVKGGYNSDPGIHPGPSGTTLTIRGTGTLNASSNGSAPGIGSRFNRACGNIVIEGGSTTATGGQYAAGIGSARFGSCGDITITTGITSVRAVKGYDAPYSIGSGKGGSCGTVTIGGIEMGCIETSPLTFTPADIVSVSFDANGGTGTMDSQAFIRGIPQNLNGSTFTAPDDYGFNGWNTKADGSGTAYAAGQSITVDGNVTLYAQWKSKVIDLSQIPLNPQNLYSFAKVEALDGDIFTGTAGGYVQINIPDGITVTLRNAHIAITAYMDKFYYITPTEPAIVCNGSATIILEGYNYVEGGETRHGIVNNGTLTIRGNGALDVVGGAGKEGISGNVACDGDFIEIGIDEDFKTHHITILSRNPLLPDAAGNGNLLGAYNGQSGINVTLSGRTLYKDGDWNTLCLPFNATKTGPLAGAIVKELDTETTYNGHKTGLEGGTLYLNFKDAESIVAGKPYIVKWTDGENIESPSFSGVAINANAPAAVMSEDGKVKFVGNYDPFGIDGSNIDEIIYLGSGNTIGYASAPRTLRNYRAHFEMPTQSGNRAMTRAVMNFGGQDGTVTLIVTLDNDNFTNADNVWYLLDGRRVEGEPTQEGLYINGGRKVLIK